jgi:ubiquinone/menaquinone biosynthesis C-methylase UbiE
VIGRSAAWQLFEPSATRYEAWYATPRGRRADSAERALLERLLDPFGEAQRALEVGCGTGHFTRWLATRLAYVVGLDRAPAMLAEARRLCPSLLLIQGDAQNLPIRSRAVDLSLLVTTLEFVDSPTAALAEAVRVARRGVLVMVLNRWSVGGLSRRWGADAKRPLLGRARDFTLPSLRMLASTAAGPRLRGLRWAAALFPGAPVGALAPIPFGDIVGLAVELTA